METVYSIAINYSAYCLLRYVASYVHQGERGWLKYNTILLLVSIGLLALHTVSFNLFRGPLYEVVASGPALCFAVEAFILQVIYQKYYGNGQFIVMNLLFMLLLDAFAIQYVLQQDYPVLYVVTTVLLFITFFFLEAPTYRQLVTAGEMAEVERANAEESIRQTNRANQAKSNFLANTSHEIRTPMNAILGMNEMILKEAQDRETQEAARDIQKAGQHLLRVINNILDISKIESGKMELFTEDFHQWRIIRDLEDYTYKEIREQGKDSTKVKFVLDIDKTLPDHLHGDVVRLRQITMNLIENAIKYTRRGTVIFRLRGKMKSASRIMLIFSVIDTGIGIRTEELSRIFEPFERMNLVETRDVLGAGLGLPLVRNLVKLMGGTIDIESGYGQGTEVRVEVPLLLVPGSDVTIAEYEEQMEEAARRKAESEAQERHTTEEGPFACPDARILVVDDTPVNLVVAKGMLSPTKAQVDMVESGEDALKAMEKTHYDLVFLDHKMPGMDGVETLERARTLQNTDGTIFVALTANADARAQYLGLGFDDYLPKPFKSEAMVALLRAYVKKVS